MKSLCSKCQQTFKHLAVHQHFIIDYVINRLSYSWLSDTIFISLRMISKLSLIHYAQVLMTILIPSRAIKILSPRSSYDNLILSCIAHTCFECTSVPLVHARQSIEYFFSIEFAILIHDFWYAIILSILTHSWSDLNMRFWKVSSNKTFYCLKRLLELFNNDGYPISRWRTEQNINCIISQEETEIWQKWIS